MAVVVRKTRCLVGILKQKQKQQDKLQQSITREIAESYMFSCTHILL